MQNLLNFIWRQHFTILFILLELISFTLLVQGNKFHKASFFNSSNALSGGLYSMLNDVSDYIELKRVNEELAHENAKLRSMAVGSFVKLEGAQILVNDSIYRQQYRYLGAKVINNSVNKRNNLITLNKGNAQGIIPGMGVISPNGVVGIVKGSSENYSVVISTLSGRTNLSVKLKKNDYFGLLKWEESDDPETATLYDIPSHVNLAKGDTVVTYGSSTIYPAGVLVGWVDRQSTIAGSDFYKVKVRLSTGFSNLSYVYVVRNLMKQEQLLLEETAHAQTDK